MEQEIDFVIIFAHQKIFYIEMDLVYLGVHLNLNNGSMGRIITATILAHQVNIYMKIAPVYQNVVQTFWRFRIVEKNFVEFLVKKAAIYIIMSLVSLLVHCHGSKFKT